MDNSHFIHNLPESVILRKTYLELCHKKLFILNYIILSEWLIIENSFLIIKIHSLKYTILWLKTGPLSFESKLTTLINNMHYFHLNYSLKYDTIVMGI